MDGITEHAGHRLLTLLKEVDAPTEKCMRFLRANDGSELTFDNKREHDRVSRHADRDVLLVDPLTMERCSGLKLDYRSGGFCLVCPAKGRLIGG